MPPDRLSFRGLTKLVSLSLSLSLSFVSRFFREKAIIEETGGEDVVVLKKKEKKKEGEDKK